MDLTGFSFQNRQLTIMTFLLLIFAGFFSYNNMSRSENPGYIIRTAQITTTMPGASPERMELLISDKIEKHVQQLPEVEYIRSENKTGISVIYVDILERYTNMREIWDNLRRKVEDAERDLPDDAAKPIVDDEFGDTYGIVFAIIGDGFSYAEIKDIADDIRDDLKGIPDVAKVDILGVQDERVFIDYYDEKLAEVGLSPDQLGEILRRQNIIQSGGVIDSSLEQIALEPTGDFKSIDDIRSTLIKIPDTKKLITLGDIANVYRGYIHPPRIKMRTSGFPSLGIAISMRAGGNILQLGENIHTYIKQLKQNYPIGVEFEMIAFEPDRVEKKISEFMMNLLQAIVIVCAVMLFFLGLRTGLVVASLIPIAILITFVAMGYLNIGLDQVSLASLMIALGMLVDNAIVICESVLVEMKEGKKAMAAAIDSANELKTSLLISSLTTAAAFLPIYLAQSQTGEYVRSIFTVVTITLLASWVTAMTLIPLLCVWILKVEKEKEGEDPIKSSTFYSIYRKFLITMLRFRWVSIGFAALAFTLAMYGLNYVPNIFFPPSDLPILTVELENPIGSSIFRTENVIQHMDELLTEKYKVNDERKEGVIQWTSYVGYGGPRWRLQHNPEAPNPYYSYSIITATDQEAQQEVINGLNAFFFREYPDIKPKVRALEEGTPVKHPIEVRVSGRDINILYRIVDQVKEKLESISGTRSIDDDWGMKTKKIVVKVDEARANRAEVSNEDIARSMESALSGVSLTEYREEDKLIPVVMRSVAAKDSNMIESQTFNIFSESSAESVPIQQVADIGLVWEPGLIKRRNRFKTITVNALLDHGVTANNVEQVLIPWLDEQKKEWPLGYNWALGGENESSGKATRSIRSELPMAAMAIIFLLMLQFNDVRRTLIILCTIPLAMIGVTIGLLVTGSYFGFMTFLGIISLAGIVINNAIVLLDRIKIEINDNGRSPQDAIIIATQKRLRPILLTTVTTISGLLPLWFGGGALWEPMAIAIIFGLMVSTVLTLGVVPVLYALFFNVSFKQYVYGKES